MRRSGSAWRAGLDAQGIALVSSLMVIAVLLVLGVGSLVLTQSNLLAAENLAANAVAKANAEAGVDATVAWLGQQFMSGAGLPQQLDRVPATGFGGLGYELAPSGGYFRNADGTVTLRIVGRGPRQAEHVSEALVAFTEAGGASWGSPFHGSVVGCEGIDVSGSGRIDSYDSRIGPYSVSSGAAGHVRTTSPGATVRVTGSSPIYGDVASTGGVYASGSARVIGDILASAKVELTASATYEGDVRTTGDVTVSNSATIYGSVSSNGAVSFTNAATVRRDVYAGGNITFTNNAQVLGDAVAGGDIIRPQWVKDAKNIKGAVRTNAGPVNNAPVQWEACDPVGVPSLVSQYSKLAASPAINIGGSNKWTLSPSGMTQTSGEGGKKSIAGYTSQQVELFGQPVRLFHVPSVKVDGSGALTISGGHVLLVVDGDFKYLGGGEGLVIEPGSSLTILVAGKFEFGSSQSSKTSGGIPPIHVFSSYANSGNNAWNAGVMVSGSGRLDATIYAPFSDVGITGSGELYGSVRGRSVSVTGSGKLHYDEALADANLGVPGSAQALERSVRVVSRR